MQTSKYIVLAPLIVSSIYSMSVVAAPQISAITLGNGGIQETVVTGQNFDLFDGKVVSWDDFEQHAASANISGLKPISGPAWTTLYGYTGSGAIIDTTRAISGKKSAHIDWSKDKADPRAFGWSNQGPFSKLYISYWRYMSGNFEAGTSNHKQFYLYGNKNDLPQGMPLIPAGTTGWGFHPNFDTGAITEQNPNPNNYNNKGWTWQNTNSKFHRWEFFIQLNTPYTMSNGVIKAWLDGKLGIDNTAYKGRNVDGEFVDFKLGHMADGFESSAKAWLDDVYISTTQARIEICDSNIYSECTVKHLQYVTANNWSETKISFNLRNLSAFKGSNIFLYVIDKNGAQSNPIALPKPLPPNSL